MEPFQLTVIDETQKVDTSFGRKALYVHLGGTPAVAITRDKGTFTSARSSGLLAIVAMVVSAAFAC